MPKVKGKKSTGKNVIVTIVKKKKVKISSEMLFIFVYS